MISYSDAVDYIENLVRFTEKHSPDHTRKCLEILGKPDSTYESVHVAGTNGKGSTCAFLSSVFCASGIRCGRFTSPHLITMRERFALDDRTVSEDDFCRAFSEVMAAVKKADKEGIPHPAYFEFLYLMACVIFRNAKVRIAVVETGLGGRLDATNTLDKPLVCVITSVGKDHMAYLGDTIPQIAAEKAGIIKAGVPVVFDDTDSRVAEVIKRTAVSKGCPVFPLSECLLEEKEIRDDTIIARGSCGDVYEIPFNAGYQIRNASLAVKTACLLTGFEEITSESIREGIANASWRGRMQRLAPRVYADGAHNEDGIREFVLNARRISEGGKAVLVFAAMSDKDYPRMIKNIAEDLHPARVITTTVEGGRAADGNVLADLFAGAGVPEVSFVPEASDAVEKTGAPREDEFIFYVGSLYFIGEVLKIYGEKHD
ncbi:MAG: bifunctional folylpolyglutamate synthase/dihydrofolate synthase [Lachnospiraceae bacterium]|jgi:dihydrofolate synthase/folylpolyglutamate synthase